MAMLVRLARLVRADLNAVLDRLEAPEVVLTQAVADMERALAGERQALAGLDRELERLARRDRILAAEESRCGDVLSGATVQGPGESSPADRDALLRPLIRHRLETARRRRDLGARVAELAAERECLAGRIRDHGARLEALRARAALAVPELERDASDGAGDDPEDSPPGDVWGSARPGGPARVLDAEVELELARLRRAGDRGGAS